MGFWNWLYQTFFNTRLAAVVSVAVPLAIGGLWAFDEFKDAQRLRELARQCEVVQDAAQDKLNTLNEARSDEKDAQKAIDDGTFADWLERMQSED